MTIEIFGTHYEESRLGELQGLLRVRGTEKTSNVPNRLLQIDGRIWTGMGSTWTHIIVTMYKKLWKAMIAHTTRRRRRR